MADSVTDYLSTGNVRHAADGNLSIVSVDESTIRVSFILSGGIDVRKKLADGQSHADIIDGLNAIQHLTKTFPISALRCIRWNDFNHEVIFEYEADGRTKRVDSYINSDEERTRLISVLQKHFPGEFRHEEQPAGILKVSWSYFFGAFLALLGTVFLWQFWDPAALARRRGGWLFVALGKSACLAIGIATIFICLACAWLAIRKRSMCYSCIIQD